MWILAEIFKKIQDNAVNYYLASLVGNLFGDKEQGDDEDE